MKPAIMSRLTTNDRLSADQLAGVLAAFPDWQLVEKGLKIRRTLHFSDFVQAFGFMTEAAFKAEALNHHPEWKNVWNRLDIELTTHTAGGLTKMDLDLARALDELANRYSLVCPADSGESCGGCR